MTQNFTVGADAGEARISASQGFQGQGRRKSLRGLFALGFLVLSAAISYGAVFILIDKWYKGGSLGLF